MRLFEELALVVAFVLTAATFFFSGALAGAICLFFALCLVVVLWTPVRGWLAIPPRDGEKTADVGANSREARHEPLSIQESPAFSNAEVELALIHQETNELVTERGREWPYLAPDLEATIPVWVREVGWFIGLILGPAQQSAFEVAAGKGDDELERLESAVDFLGKLSTTLTPQMVRADTRAITEASDRRRTGLLARLYQEGEKLMGECSRPNGRPAEQLAVRLGSPVTDQVVREDNAREWDEMVAAQLRGRPYLKQLAPGWEKAGAAIQKAAGHPDQSQMSGHSLKSWYGGKLDCLWGIIQSVSPTPAGSAQDAA